VVFLTILHPKFGHPNEAKIRLTIVSISSILHSSFLTISNNPTLYFWGFYEVDFPEGSNMKAPRGFRFSFGAFFSAFY